MVINFKDAVLKHLDFCHMLIQDGQEPNGNDDDENTTEKQLPRKRVQGTSKDASAVRKLPGSATTPPPVVPDQPNPERKVIYTDPFIFFLLN